MEMLCLMHEAEPRGYLVVNGQSLNTSHIASFAGISHEEADALLEELERAGVFSRKPDGTIYSRRMLKDTARANKAKENGKAGGNPALNRDGDNSDKAEVIPEVKPEVNGQHNTHWHLASGLSKDVSGEGVSARERLDAIEREAREAAGLEQDPSPSLLSLAPLIGLLDAGYDWRVDILPELRKGKAKGVRPTTWAYYVPAITAGKAKNAAIPPKPAEKQGKPVVWLSQDDPRWPSASDRYARETGKAAKAHGSKHEDGLGFHFPAEFLPDSHPRDSFSQLSGTNGTQA